MATNEQLLIRENQETVSHQTRRQHDELIQAMHRLEAALASPAPGRERRWAARAAQDLRAVRELLQWHIVCAEGAGGLLAELDINRPSIAARVDELRQEHRLLLEKVKALEHGLSRQENAHDFTSKRQQAEQFLAALRRHHISEVDLIYECFWLDIGVGD